MSAALSKARVSELAAEIRRVGESARKADPQTRGRVSYPAMCGGLHAIVSRLVRELSGDRAAAYIDAAFADAYRDPPEGEAP